ncbi:response regulator [Paenibacillus periandrae]|uniref:response regulator n=1 Tax=Paenibacillus periandrae TaxID=1761741 RepID=UPI001F095B7E|nr:response regulator [Paenibacillus periandrae]
MHNLIIADDDVIIRRGLSKNIDWVSYGFNLTGTVGSGKEALLLAEERRPDIVLSDIRMPHIDGLELAEQLIAKYPDVKIVLMTSYEEFKFAQKALKLKVFDYVLKPFENDVLIETMQRAAAEYHRESNVRKQIFDSMPLLRQLFWERLISGRFQEDELASEALFLGIYLQASHYVACVIKLDDYNSAKIRNRYGKEMLRYCVSNIIQEMTGHWEQCYIFHYDGEEIVIVFGLQDNLEVMTQRIQELMEEVCGNVEKYLKTTVTVGVGPGYERPISLQRSYLEAKAILEYRHIVGTNQVLIAKDIDLQPKIETAVLQGWEQEFLVKVKLGMREESLAIIYRLEQDVLNRKLVPLQDIHILGTEVALLLYREFWEWIHTWKMEQKFGGFTHFCRNLQTVTTSKETFAVIREFVIELIEEIGSRRDSHQKQLLGKAYRFIEENYSREELSLQDVADHVNVSAGYLSSIFKKVGNTVFSDYLLETRMKAALNLMSREDYKTYEIAYKVGFSNPQYFSVCFKKYTGLTPSDNRNSSRLRY